MADVVEVDVCADGDRFVTAVQRVEDHDGAGRLQEEDVSAYGLELRQVRVLEFLHDDGGVFGVAREKRPAVLFFRSSFFSFPNVPSLLI